MQPYGAVEDMLFSVGLSMPELLVCLSGTQPAGGRALQEFMLSTCLTVCYPFLS